MNETIVLDGSTGEGGGQILRTGLALAAVTGVPVEVFNIRAGRSKPGLAAQHVTAVRAVAAACDGELDGDRIGSTRVSMVPGRIRSGEHDIDIAAEKPSAGAVTLVMQALLPVLGVAGGPSRVRLAGGTHVEWSPSVHYMDQVLRPALAALGITCRVELREWGWYPRGGGAIEVEVIPARGFTAVDWTRRESIRAIRGVSVVNGLPFHVAERQARAAAQLLTAQLPEVSARIEEQVATGPGQGTFFFLKAEYGSRAAGFSALGRRGRPAEEVGRTAVEALLAHHRSGAAVDEHLADQLLPFLALAAGTSSFTAPRITGHLRTNAWVCERLLGTRVDLHDDHPCTVEVHGRGFRR